MNYFFAILVAVIAVTSGCNKALSNQEKQETLRLGEINPVEAVKDAEEALLKGDHRLIGIAGYNLQVVGTNLTATQAKEKYGLREINGASDYLSEADAKYLPAAHEYVKTYNQVIITAVQSEEIEEIKQD